jgi:hypothetical protein
MSKFTLQQTKAAIDRLYKEVWPMMAGVGERYGDCRRQAEVILALVNKQPDQDLLLPVAPVTPARPGPGARASW